MAALQNSTLDAMKNKQAQLLGEWTQGLVDSGATRNLKEHDLQQQTSEFLQLVVSGLENDNGTNIAAPGWETTRQFLEKLSHSRALLGQDSQQTASFIFALKGPLFALLQSHYGNNRRCWPNSSGRSPNCSTRSACTPSAPSRNPVKR